MKRVLSVTLFLGLLAACGTDGEPEQPVPTDGSQGVRVTGDAWGGIAVGQSGTRAYGGIGLSNGPVSIFFGF